MRQNIINLLEYLLENTNDKEVGVFETYREREEVTVSVNDEDEQYNRTDEEGGERITSGRDAEAEQTTTANTEESSEEPETAREVTTTIRRDNKIRILTVEGAQFVNAILDTYVAQRVQDYFMNELYRVGEPKHPNINLFNVLNESGLSYYSKDAEIFDVAEEKLVLNFDNKTDSEIDWIRDENGDPYMPMDPVRYEMMWNRIIKASKMLDSKEISCNKQITKPVQYWTNIKLAYNDENQLYRKYGETVKVDDLMLTSITQPKFRLNADIIGRPEVNRCFSDLDKAMWLAGKIGSNSEEISETSSNNNASKPGSRFQKIAKGGKKRN